MLREFSSETKVRQLKLAAIAGLTVQQIFWLDISEKCFGLAG
jgi:hypothetical protein